MGVQSDSLSDTTTANVERRCRSAYYVANHTSHLVGTVVLLTLLLETGDTGYAGSLRVGPKVKVAESTAVQEYRYPIHSESEIKLTIAVIRICALIHFKTSIKPARQSPSEIPPSPAVSYPHHPSTHERSTPQ
jgi:hypothetical protein